MESEQGYLSKIREKLRVYMEKYRAGRRERQIDRTVNSACVDFPQTEEEDRRIRAKLRKFLTGEEVKK